MVEIATALIGFAGIIVVQIVQSNKHNAILETKFQGLEERIDLKINNLADDVQKHNNVIERTYQLETKISVLEEAIKHG